MKDRPYQSYVIRECDQHGVMILSWRRQGGKTTTFSKISLKKMMKRPGRLVTFATASLLLGREIIYKDAGILQGAIADLQQQARAAQMELQTCEHGRDKELKNLAQDDFADLFEAQRLEFRLYHDRHTVSRTQVIAPNPATARGWTGDVMIDEIGHIQDFRSLWEAMEPIVSSNPDFRVLMAGTPPNDDAHYSFELLVPPAGLDFEPRPEGNTYVSEAGFFVHRVDAYDAMEANVPLYDLHTRAPISPEQHRQRAHDREAWDLNYGLKLKHGGTSACSLLQLQTAQDLGRDECLAAEIEDEDELDEALREVFALLTGGPIGVGYDVATTTNKKSNPSSLAIVEQVQRDYVTRLILRWRTADPEVARLYNRETLQMIRRRPAGRARRLCIDATNERYFATDIRRYLSREAFVQLVVSSETLLQDGQPMTYKTYLGNRVVNALEDGRLLLPPDRWVRDDFRLVKKERGLFVNELDDAGNHGDSFDAVKLAMEALGSKQGALTDPNAVRSGTGHGTGMARFIPRWMHRGGRWS